MLTCALLKHKHHHGNNGTLEIFAYNVASQNVFCAYGTGMAYP